MSHAALRCAYFGNILDDVQERYRRTDPPRTVEQERNLDFAAVAAVAKPTAIRPARRLAADSPTWNCLQFNPVSASTERGRGSPGAHLHRCDFEL